MEFGVRMANRVNNMAFNNMITSTEADNTNVANMFGEEGARINRKTVHNMLMAAGMTPIVGNIADAADAILYALEGEFGSAALSTAAMIPYLGQAVSGKKALQIAKESGEEMVTFYRGVDKWHRSKHALTHSVKPGVKIVGTGDQMVKGGKFIGGGEYKAIKSSFASFNCSSISDALWVTTDRGHAIAYMKGKPNSILLEFQVPRSVVESSDGFRELGNWGSGKFGIFGHGLDKTFLTKLTKWSDLTEVP